VTWEYQPDPTGDADRLAAARQRLESAISEEPPSAGQSELAEEAFHLVRKELLAAADHAGETYEVLLGAMQNLDVGVASTLSQQPSSFGRVR
jgi:hypothetical protein